MCFVFYAFTHNGDTVSVTDCVVRARSVSTTPDVACEMVISQPTIMSAQSGSDLGARRTRVKMGFFPMK